MRTAIVSDLHLGSKHSRVEPFLRFLDALPAETELVLNGDVVDHWRGRLEGKHLAAQQRLKDESFRRHIVWVRGNHDEKYAVEDPGRIAMVKSYSIGKRLYVSHGYDFDTVMPYHQTFIRIFRFIHRVRVRLGAEAVHVAYYAKRFEILYGVLRKHVAMNAVEYARENGYGAVTCGHTHYAEDTLIDGIRYINTGAWTEPPGYCLDVTDGGMQLVAVATHD
jgi:UDP-2,3-diacylglucosamine pyrophosphatase LpxH